MVEGLQGNGGKSLFGGRVPIVIGVTGHRKLGELETAIAGAIAAECRKLKSRYPHTPFLVLSALAEGADRLVAKIAMKELGAKLCAVLPFPPDEYEKDFGSPASCAEFRDLLGRADCRVDVYKPGEASEWSVPGEGRNRQYARQGGLISEQAQIMFAVWDGLPSRGTGGTADVAGWFEQGYPPKQYSAFPSDISPLDPSEPGLGIWINSKTGKAGKISGAASPAMSGIRKMTLRERRRSNIEQILKRTERFNRDILLNAQLIARNTPLVPPGNLPDGAALEAGAAYLASDALAVSYASRVRRADTAVYMLALLAIFFFGMINNWPLASWAYFAAAGAVAATIVYIRWRSFDARFVEYRGVAEALRILFFWRLLGIRKPVWLSYLSKHAGVVHWVRHAVRALEFCEEAQGKGKTPAAGGLELAEKFWVESQINYYRKASDRHWRHYRRWISIARIAFALSFVIAVLLSAAAYVSADPAGPGGLRRLFAWPDEQIFGLPWPLKSVTDALQMVLGLLAAAGVAARAFLARRADFELAKQFGSTQAIFERAGRNLKDAQPAGANAEWTPAEIFEKLGREALLEHAEWLWVRHTRPFEMPN